MDGSGQKQWRFLELEVRFMSVGIAVWVVFRHTDPEWNTDLFLT